MGKKQTLVFFLACLLFVLGACSGDTAPLQISPETASEAVSEPETSEPVTLRLAICGGGTFDCGLITAFELTNERYTVEVVDYYADANYDYEKAIQKLVTELIGGNGPDLIDLSSVSLDLARYAEKGALEDLRPWIESDPELCDSEFVDSVLSLCEYEDGLYAVLSGFTVKTMYGSENIGGTISEWSLDEFYNYSNALGSANLSADSSFTLDGEDFLAQLCSTSVKSFIDYENATAYFDSEEFIELLDCCKEMEEQNLQEPVLRIDSIMNFFEIQYQRYCLGGELCYLGMPGLMDSSAQSYVNNQNNYLAMSALSEHKEAAWSFLRYCLTEEYQNAYVERAVTNAFPTNMASLEALIERSKARIYYVDESGKQVEQTQRGMYEYIYSPASDDDIEKILELIYSVSCMQNYDPVIAEIVQSEAAAFFASDKTAEETADIIQSRAMLYLNEMA